jgi:hypothetical protein
MELYAKESEIIYGIVYRKNNKKYLQNKRQSRRKYACKIN